MEFSRERDSVEWTADEAFLTTPAGKFRIQETPDGVRVDLVESYRRHREVMVLLPRAHGSIEIAVGLT